MYPSREEILKNTKSPKKTKFDFFNLTLINCRSIRNRIDFINDIIYTQNIDIAVLTETWLNEDDQAVISSITLNNFNFYHTPRITSTHGGGIGIITRKPIKLISKSHGNYKTFDSIHCCLNITDSKHIDIIALYRPPHHNIHPFLNEFIDLSLNIHTKNIVVLGDFNVLLYSGKQTAKLMVDTLNMLNLKQHVDFPTHTGGNTLDLIISPTDSNMISNPIRGSLITDHYSLNFQIKSSRNIPDTSRTIHTRLY